MTTINGECLTNTQIVGRELQQRYLEKQNPVALNAYEASKSTGVQNVPTPDGRTTAVQGSKKSAPVKAYGSPANKYIDITV
jgi:hypothetical protein